MEFTYELKILKNAVKDHPGKVALIHVLKDAIGKKLGETLVDVKDYSGELNQTFLTEWVSGLPSVTEVVNSLKEHN